MSKEPRSIWTADLYRLQMKVGMLLHMIINGDGILLLSEKRSLFLSMKEKPAIISIGMTTAVDCGKEKTYV